MADQEFKKAEKKFESHKEEFTAKEMIEVMAVVLKHEPFDKVIESNPFLLAMFSEYASRVVATLFCMKESEDK